MSKTLSAHKPTVLLVNLPHDDRGMYAEYLRLCEFTPIEIDNRSEALSAARTADVVVTDIHVQARFDGVGLVRDLRAGRDTRDTPIIVLTASAFASDRERAFAAGCDKFLSKPCLPDRLLSEIQAVLAHRLSKRSDAVASASNDEERTARVDQMLGGLKESLRAEQAALARKMPAASSSEDAFQNAPGLKRPRVGEKRS